jgi:hypothetical protein
MREATEWRTRADLERREASLPTVVAALAEADPMEPLLSTTT